MPSHNISTSFITLFFLLSSFPQSSPHDRHSQPHSRVKQVSREKFQGGSNDQYLLANTFDDDEIFVSPNELIEEDSRIQPPNENPNYSGDGESDQRGGDGRDEDGRDEDGRDEDERNHKAGSVTVTIESSQETGNPEPSNQDDRSGNVRDKVEIAPDERVDDDAEDEDEKDEKNENENENEKNEDENSISFIYDEYQLRVYPDNQTVRVGQEAVLRCRDEGPKRSPVWWSRSDGRPLPTGATDVRGRLTLYRVSPEDGGSYTCSIVDGAIGSTPNKYYKKKSIVTVDTCK